MLLNLIAHKVESKCGNKPENQQVMTFLREKDPSPDVVFPRREDKTTPRRVIGSGEGIVGRPPPKRQNKSTWKLHVKVYPNPGYQGDYLLAKFEVSPEDRWNLPTEKSDKSSIRAALNAALKFGLTHGATKGQLHAIRKALTDAGYHPTR